MSTTSRPTVELWIRALRTGGSEEHDELRRRLVTLDHRGVVDSVHVRTWPHDVTIDRPTTRRERTIADRVRTFRRWAGRRGVSLPAFGERTTAGVGRMGPECEVVTLPRTALAVWCDGTLEWVAPCVADGRVYTPREWVEEATEGRAPGVDRGPMLVA